MPSDRTRVRRQPERGRYDRASLNSVLDAGLVAHVAFVDGDQPVCLPMLYGRVGDTVYVHGSTASRAVRALVSGAPACLTVTMLDGLVLARSVYEHSANYRSAVLFGPFRRVEPDEEKLAALRRFADQLVPDRWDEVRPPSALELKATTILALAIGEASVKVRTGPPSDGGTPDAERDIWAGVVPLVTSFGAPEAAPDLRGGIPVPASVHALFHARRMQGQLEAGPATTGGAAEWDP